jgi:lysophospholipase L1-like esterase
MMCGANEGHNEWLPLEEYRTELADVLQTIQESVPGAGCLVVGPLDQAKRGSDGKLTSRRMPGKLSDVQRAVSLEHGCAFFDTYRAMGGKNSMAKWFRTGLGGGDFVHPTEEGARQIGTWLADALLAGYEQYMDDKKQCELSVTSL